MEREVEAILAKKIVQTRQQQRTVYLIKWHNFNKYTWEHGSNLKNCEALINAFEHTENNAIDENNEPNLPSKVEPKTNASSSIFNLIITSIFILLIAYYAATQITDFKITNGLNKEIDSFNNNFTFLTNLHPY